MAVAKTYESMTVIGEPYMRDKKMYVIVSGPCSRCGGSGHYSMNGWGDTTCYRCHGAKVEKKEVRWYTDSQRASMDKAAEKRAADRVIKNEERRIKFAAHNAFGFGDENYITLIYGKNNEIKEWRDTLPSHTIWYSEIFGWYMPSANHCDFPENINHLRLEWDAVRNPDDAENLTMKDNSEVRELVYKMIHGESKSEYQGSINEWLEKDVIVKKNISLTNNFGDSHMHIMEDEDENVYVWTTASKSIEEDTQLHLRMKVKDHKEYKGVKQTIVYYCKIK